MKTIAIIGAATLFAAGPALAQQTDAERRIEENLRNMETQRQLDQLRQLEQRIEELENRRRMDEVMRQFDLQAARAPVIPIIVTAPPPVTAATPAQVAELARRRQLLLESSAQRIEQLADEINNNK